ncbi:transporter substrate-binding domain-containing protein [Thalassomonas actiniarum]|uniref:Transporter substrate-binding domain-containing protein n=1 Tax=Thalassomonas actiniarum TaxID=485447 RepID=A0AAE9YUW8_9GAMM|nr:transporter substrate-binding domain-containing protein [Thalassomonas actiniarum]WDE00770.1 transporter substrate-binding domain-containing protein [Thalassomonas actiniarum]
MPAPFLLALFMCLFSFTTPCLAARDNKVSVILPFADNDHPPHYLVNDQGEITGGIEADILKAVFSDMAVEFSYIQLKRAAILLQQERYHCISPTPEELRGQAGYYESREFLSIYYNRVMVLASSPFSVNSLASLHDKRLLAFLGASKYLGDDYADLVKRNSRQYREFTHLSMAIPMLFLKRVDALVMDKNVFMYHANKQEYDVFHGKDKVLFYDFFPPSRFTLMCKNKALIDDFDASMKKLRLSGELSKIIERNVNARR